MLTNEYDVNIYVIDGIVNVLCYPMGVDEEGVFVSTDTTAEPIRLPLPLDSTDPAIQEMLGYLLGNDSYWDVSHDFLEEGYDWMDWWEEHDEWTGTIAMQDAPQSLRVWLDTLPYYDAPVTEQRGM
jgi:hypothetical protein